MIVRILFTNGSSRSFRVDSKHDFYQVAGIIGLKHFDKYGIEEVVCFNSNKIEEVTVYNGMMEELEHDNFDELSEKLQKRHLLWYNNCERNNR